MRQTPPDGSQQPEWQSQSQQAAASCKSRTRSGRVGHPILCHPVLLLCAANWENRTGPVSSINSSYLLVHYSLSLFHAPFSAPTKAALLLPSLLSLLSLLSLSLSPPPPHTHCPPHSVLGTPGHRVDASQPRHSTRADSAALSATHSQLAARARPRASPRQLELVARLAFLLAPRTMSSNTTTSTSR